MSSNAIEKELAVKNDFVVKTSSSKVNRLLGGGFYSGEVQTIYSVQGSGVQVLVVSALQDAISQGLTTVYYDLSKAVSYEMIKANGIEIDNEAFSLVRKNPSASTQSTLSLLVKEAEEIEADFVIIDLSQPSRPRLMDRITNKAQKVISYSKILSDTAAYRKWAMLLILPSNIPRWNSQWDVRALGGNGTATLVMARGSSQISISLLKKNGIPYAVDTTQELVERFVKSRFCEQDATDQKYMVAANAPDEMRAKLPSCGLRQYELADFFKRDDSAREMVENALGEDPKSALYSAIEKRLGIVSGHGCDYADKVERILTLNGEIGSFDDSTAQSVANAVETWAKCMAGSGLSVDFEHCNEEDVMTVSRALGVETSVAAALAGVPVDDIIL